MAQLTASNDIKKLLQKILAPLCEGPHKVMSVEEAAELVNRLTPILTAAGGVNTNDKNFLPNLKKAMVDCLTVLKLPEYQNPATQKAANDTFTLLFKDPQKLSVLEKGKLTLGLSCIAAMDKNKEFGRTLELLFRPELTVGEKKELGEGLEKLAKFVNKFSPNPISDKDLNDLVKLLKDEINNPGSAKDKLVKGRDAIKYDEKLAETIAAYSGKLNIGAIMANYFGVASQNSLTNPLNLVNGAFLSSLQAATGVETIAANEEKSAGIDAQGLEAEITDAEDNENLKRKDFSFLDENNEPTTTLSDFLTDLQDSMLLTTEPAKKPENDVKVTEDNILQNDISDDTHNYNSPFSMKPKPPSPFNK